MAKIKEIHVATLGLIIILILEVVALLKGIDGIIYGSSMAAIGAVIGWVYKQVSPKNGRKRN